MVRMLIAEFKADMTIQNKYGVTALMLAIECGHDNVAHALLKDYQCPVDFRGKDGDTALHYMCRKGNLKMARMLIAEFKADMMIQNKDGATPLMLAIERGCDNVAHALLKDYQCPVDVRDKDGNTVLHYACEYNATQSMKTLIQKYKVALGGDEYVPMCVVAAAVSGDVGKVKELLDNSNCDINSSFRFGQDRNTWTPLQWACDKGNLDMVRMLIAEFKADMTIQNKDGDTALMLAIECGHKNVAYALLKDYQCPVDVRGKDGNTALHCMCRKGNLKMARMLIAEFNADMMIQNKDGASPLMLAIEHGYDDVAHALLEDYQCPVDVRDKDGDTVLHYACRANAAQSVKTLLLKYKVALGNDMCVVAAAVSVDVGKVKELLDNSNCENIINSSFRFGQDRNTWTLLQWACDKGNLDMVRMLIAEFKADMTIQNKYGVTALMLAIEHGHDNVAHALLEDYQCPVNVRDKHGDTALHYACRANATQSMKTLIQKYHAEQYLVGDDKDIPLCVVAAALSGDVGKVRQLLDSSSCSINSSCDNRNLDSFWFYQKNWNSLHYACVWGEIDMARMLIAEFKADMTVQDKDGTTALMLAIKHGHDDLAHALLKDYQCPVDIRDEHGDTVIHYACRENATRSLKILLQKYKVNMCLRNPQNDTPLHVAARHGQQEAVLALINEFGCDVLCKGYNGQSALHRACAGGHVDIVKYLSKYISPLVVDDNGNTPLHTCAVHDHIDCGKALILALYAPVLVRNNAGKTPKGIAKGDFRSLLKTYTKVRYDTIHKLAIKRYSGSEHITRIFVLGHPGAGKSSFIASLTKEGFLESFWRVSESSVPPHTPGIVPSIHTSKHYGRVLFYDFAGDAEYYSSHAAILENLAHTSKGGNIFIIVVDLREDSHKISSFLNYWVSFMQYQLFITVKRHLVILGSHLDLVTVEKANELEKIGNDNKLHHSGCFTLDCCKPKSKEMSLVVQHITTLVKDSPRYSLSIEGSVLLGLLEMDFQHVTACPIQTIISHIEDTDVCLPTDVQFLCPILSELHELGLLFMIKGGQNDVQLLLNVSQLTHDVHQQLFSEEAIRRLREKSGNASLFHVGIVSEGLLSKVLPAHITEEILFQLQYRQVIHHKDVGTFCSSDQYDSSVQSYLFFPALCSAEKSDTAWVTSPDLSYGIGWLARCTDPRDYFPPRFYHVLFLRLVHRFTPKVSVSSADQHTGPHQYRCTMWKTGLHWSMREGVECEVELVHDSRGVVIRVISKKEKAENCFSVIKQLIKCVMEAKAEFCHTVKPEFFLLNPTSEADYLNPDNLFAMNEVNEALVSATTEIIFSVEGKGQMERSSVLWMRKLTLWNSLFPIDTAPVLKCLENVSKNLYLLGVFLGLPTGVLDAIEKDFPNNTARQRTELVRRWLSSSLDPCWWHLAQALKQIKEGVLADEIEKNEGELHADSYYFGRVLMRY